MTILPPKEAFRTACENRPKRPPVYSLRFTWEERALLEKACIGEPWSAYIRRKVFDEAASPRKRRKAAPSVDQQAISRILASLGNSRLSSNLNQIAKAANMGALPVTPDLTAELEGACADISAMRSDLIAALGLKEVRQ